MPDSEQLGIICLLGLLLVLYVIGLSIKYLLEYWYVTAGIILSFSLAKLWMRRWYHVYLDDEDDHLEPVHQE